MKRLLQLNNLQLNQKKRLEQIHGSHMMFQKESGVLNIRKNNIIFHIQKKQMLFSLNLIQLQAQQVLLNIYTHLPHQLIQSGQHLIGMERIPILLLFLEALNTLNNNIITNGISELQSQQPNGIIQQKTPCTILNQHLTKMFQIHKRILLMLKPNCMKNSKILISNQTETYTEEYAKERTIYKIL